MAIERESKSSVTPGEQRNRSAQVFLIAAWMLTNSAAPYGFLNTLRNRLQPDCIQRKPLTETTQKGGPLQHLDGNHYQIIIDPRDIDITIAPEDEQVILGSGKPESFKKPEQRKAKPQEITIQNDREIYFQDTLEFTFQNPVVFSGSTNGLDAYFSDGLGLLYMRVLDLDVTTKLHYAKYIPFVENEAFSTSEVGPTVMGEFLQFRARNLTYFFHQNRGYSFAVETAIADSIEIGDDGRSITFLNEATGRSVKVTTNNDDPGDINLEEKEQQREESGEESLLVIEIPEAITQEQAALARMIDIDFRDFASTHLYGVPEESGFYGNVINPNAKDLRITHIQESDGEIWYRIEYGLDDSERPQHGYVKSTQLVGSAHIDAQAIAIDMMNLDDAELPDTPQAEQPQFYKKHTALFLNEDGVSQFPPQEYSIGSDRKMTAKEIELIELKMLFVNKIVGAKPGNSFHIDMTNHRSDLVVDGNQYFGIAFRPEYFNAVTGKYSGRKFSPTNDSTVVLMINEAYSELDVLVHEWTHRKGYIEVGHDIPAVVDLLTFAWKSIEQGDSYEDFINKNFKYDENHSDSDFARSIQADEETIINDYGQTTNPPREIDFRQIYEQTQEQYTAVVLEN